MAGVECAVGRFQREVKSELLGREEANDQEKERTKRMKALFAEKVFVERESLLTELQKKDDFRTIQNVLVAMVVILTFYIVTEEFYETGRVIDFGIITFAFSKSHIVLETWGVLVALGFSVVPVVQLVKTSRPTRYFFIPLAIAPVALSLWGPASSTTCPLPQRL